MSHCRRSCARSWPTSFLAPCTFDYSGKAAQRMRRSGTWRVSTGAWSSARTRTFTDLRSCWADNEDMIDYPSSRRQFRGSRPSCRRKAHPGSCCSSNRRMWLLRAASSPCIHTDHVTVMNAPMRRTGEVSGRALGSFCMAFAHAKDTETGTLANSRLTRTGADGAGATARAAGERQYVARLRIDGWRNSRTVVPCFWCC
jgi:hypothetical protein